MLSLLIKSNFTSADLSILCWIMLNKLDTIPQWVLIKWNSENISNNKMWQFRILDRLPNLCLYGDFYESVTYGMGETKLKTQKIAKLEQFIRGDVFKISGRQLPEEFFEGKKIGRIWHFLMEESEYWFSFFLNIVSKVSIL